MTHKEIIDIEQENTRYINLHLEGTFYKAYEQSAFAFCTRIKAYNVLRKDSKGRPLMKTFPEICGIKCAVYLPDDWDLDRFPVKDSYDAATWAAAESRGAVCFPLAGCHGGGYKDYPLKELRDYNVDGHYWTTDIFDEPYVKQSAWAICLPTDYGFHQWAKFTYFDSYGCSIRLVKEKK